MSTNQNPAKNSNNKCERDFTEDLAFEKAAVVRDKIGGGIRILTLN